MSNYPRVADPLCCCEYIDKDGRRNHILACCCNCLDKAVDNICCCRNDGGPSCDRVLLSMMDRLRFPWLGGAHLISCDVLLPMVILPPLFAFAALDFTCTVIAFLLVPCFLALQLKRGYFRFLKSSKFFVSWTYCSFALIFLIYEFLVVPFLEISPEENWVVILSFWATIGLIVKVQTTKDYHIKHDVESVGSLSSTKTISTCEACGCYISPRMAHCAICQKCVSGRELHCLFGCCIGSHNLRWFMICLVLMTFNLLYSSNLILTTVCRPYRVFGSVLLPEDCSEVYYEFKFGLSFVSGLYSLIMSVISTFSLLRQCLLISLGLTGNEWRTLPLPNILCLGISAPRPYSHGILKNWFYFCVRCRNQQ
ncbi:LOW QUALITY PROTEIN: Palmitoyltransferase ZDHHC23 [Frankliniella fusca]|uniref:Palmitoyltransferase n=1 Tax=Frankliniella fusca TaxID=407009 RepID=A0AAE1H1Y8_9NEOP|nr:LOW QUALITY PROTEIN: Palmitoyltransferase ZDHHC23 [Frankliniella fusca]